MRLAIAEILRSAAEQRDDLDKVTMLTMNDSPALRKMIKYVLDPNVQWWEFLKGERPKFRANRYLDGEGMLYREVEKLYRFTEGGDDWIGLKPENILSRLGLQRNPKKRQALWIQLLESVTIDDAELLISAPLGRFPFEGLTREVVAEAFPGLLPGMGSEQMVPQFKEPAMHGIPPQRPAQTIKILTVEDILGKQR